MFALGRIKPRDFSDAEQTASVLLPYVGARNEEASRYNSLSALLALCEHFPELGPVYVPQAMESAAVDPPQGLLFHLARALWDHKRIFDRFSTATALSTLKATDPSLKGITQGIDLALSRILDTSESDLAQDFLTEVLASEQGFDLELFPSTRHHISTKDRDRLFKLLVRWLISGNSALGAATLEILRDGQNSAPFHASTDGLGLDGEDHIFLARKAIGWLFVNSVVAASILVACRHLKVAIVICIGGDVHENVRSQLTQFTKKNTKRNISFEEWNGDKLAELLLTGVLREELLPKQLRSSFQKAVAMVDQPDIAYEHFRRLLVALRARNKNSKDAVRIALTDLPVNGDGSDLLQLIAEACKANIGFASLSAVASGNWPLVLTACRHYRLPIPPQFWIGMFASPEPDAPSSSPSQETSTAEPSGRPSRSQ